MVPSKEGRIPSNRCRIFDFNIYERCFLACPAPNYGNSLFGAGRFVRFSAISIAYWRFMFAFWQTCGYFNIFSNNVNKKMTKKALFLATENAEKIQFTSKN